MAQRFPHGVWFVSLDRGGRHRDDLGAAPGHAVADAIGCGLTGTAPPRPNSSTICGDGGCCRCWTTGWAILAGADVVVDLLRQARPACGCW
ncbi:MAG: hypothetical protein R2838_01795 [Caldilineaceae bacterium]